MAQIIQSGFAAKIPPATRVAEYFLDNSYTENNEATTTSIDHSALLDYGQAICDLS